MPFWLATAMYAVAFLLYMRWFRDSHATSARAATRMLVLTVVVQSVGWVVLGLTRGFGPPAGLGETLSLVALSTALIYLYLELRGGERGLAPFALGLVLVLMLKASLAGPSDEVSELLTHQLFAPHATAIILAMTGFTISAFLSIAYLAQYRQLRGRQPGLLLRRLPSLQGLDSMTRRATRIGWFFLTAGLILGSLLWHRVWGEYWTWDPKQCVTLLTWMLYGGALYLRRRREWQGERIATVNLVAFSSVILGLILLQTVFHTAHDFGVVTP